MYVFVCVCVCVCSCQCEFVVRMSFCVFFQIFELCDGMLSYVLFCSAWMHGAHVQVLRCSFIKFHGCDCIYGSEF